MADITFVDQVTVVPALWLNDINIAVYRALGLGTAPLGVAPTTAGAVRNNIGLNAVTATGTADALVIAVPGTYTLADGAPFVFKAAANNVNAPTLNVNSLGVKNIVRPDGTAPGRDSLVAGQIYQVYYNATLAGGSFQLATYPTPVQYYFTARNSAARTTAGVFATYTKILDPFNTFNNTTGVFTAPAAGLYVVALAGAITYAGANASCVIGYRLNSVSQLAPVTGQATFATNSQSTTLLQPTLLARNDTIDTELVSIAGASASAQIFLLSVFRVNWL